MFAGEAVGALALQNDCCGAIRVHILVVAGTAVDKLGRQPQKPKIVPLLGCQGGQASHEGRKVVSAHKTALLIEKEGNLPIANHTLLIRLVLLDKLVQRFFLLVFQVRIVVLNSIALLSIQIVVAMLFRLLIVFSLLLLLLLVFCRQVIISCW